MMPACGSKFVSGSSRKATVAASVFVGYSQVSQPYAKPSW